MRKVIDWKEVAGNLQVIVSDVCEALFSLGDDYVGEDDESCLDFGVFEEPPANASWFEKLMWDPEEAYNKAYEEGRIIEHADGSFEVITIDYTAFEDVHENGILNFNKKRNEIMAKKANLAVAKESV